MKVLGWMQNKLDGSNGKKKPNSISATYYMLHEPCKQEFSDWPQALLAIGTLGNNNMKEEEEDDRIDTTAGDSYSSQDCVQKLTPDDAGNLQNALKTYFWGQVETKGVIEQEEDTTDHQINQHVKENKAFADGSNSNGGNFYPNSSQINSLGKDPCLDSSKNFIGKKSLVFLLKKMFACRSGFQPTPTFRMEKVDEKPCKPLEKILRAILHKNIYSQGPRSAFSINKSLENGRMTETNIGEVEPTNDADNGSKWDKTDSEYIVLEI